MLTYLPGISGATLYAVKPGSNDEVAAAKRGYDKGRREALIISLAVGALYGFAALALSLAFLSVRGGTGLDNTLAVVSFSVIMFVIVGGGFAVMGWKGEAPYVLDSFISETQGLIRNANLLEHHYRSGRATDEQEWEAASLASEASELGQKARLMAVNNAPRPVRITPNRRAEIDALTRRAQKMESRVVRLLDPKLTRRRRRKTAVVG